MDLGAAPLAGTGLAKLGYGQALRIVLLIGVAIPPDFDAEFLAQRIHARNADPVQTAGDLVVRSVKLAAGMELRQHDLDGWHAFACRQHHVVDRDATAVVRDRDRVVDVDRYFDALRVAGQRLVNRIIDDLVDEVMQTLLASRANVHCRTKPNSLEALEDRNVFACVGLGGRNLGWRVRDCRGDLSCGHSTPSVFPLSSSPRLSVKRRESHLKH